jgi:hypothetical protein
MGNSQAKLSFNKESSVFKDELKDLSKIVNDLINADDAYVSQDYDAMTKDACQQFTMVMESRLKTYNKIELQNVKDSIYFVPHEDVAEIKNEFIKKQDLCNIITTHYTDVLRLLILIKLVFDIEHHGDNSLAGVTWRNIEKRGNIVAINYCSMTQMEPVVTIRNAEKSTTQSGGDHTLHNNVKLNLVKLRGLQYFCDHFLDAKEKVEFMKLLYWMFARKNKNQIAEILLCGSSLLTIEDGRKIMHMSQLSKTAKCAPEKAKQFKKLIETSPDPDYRFYIKKNNPIVHESTCGQPLKLFYDTSTKDKRNTTLLNKMNTLKSDYVTSLDNVLKCARHVVEMQNGKYALKNIDASTLTRVKKELKSHIIVFYLQSINNYHALLDYAKTLPVTLVNWRDLAKHAQ